MNFFFNTYSADFCRCNSRKKWKDFAAKQFGKLLHTMNISIGEQELLDITGELEYLEIPAKTVLLKEGEICNNLYFIADGAVKCFSTEFGQETYISLFVQGEIEGSFPSFVSNTPSDYTVVAARKIRAICIRKEVVTQLEKTSPNDQYITQFILSYMQALVKFNKKVVFLSQLPSSEKLGYLEKNFPDLYAQFSIKDIARFCGMHPDAISRLRNARMIKA